MTQTTFLILTYLTSLVLCLAAGYIINWDDLHTVGNFVCPLFNDNDYSWMNIFVWLPFTNTGLVALIAAALILRTAHLLLGRLFAGWKGIGKSVSRIWNMKVK